MPAVRAFQAAGQTIRWSDVKTLIRSAPLTGELMPTLVTIDDRNGPRAARIVKPDQFEKEFGAGYRFKRAWIETTNDAPAFGIAHKLPWIDNFKRRTSKNDRERLVMARAEA